MPTRWSWVARVSSDDEKEARKALEDLCRAYWYPLYAFVRRLGHSPEDAKDLAQGFFSSLLSHRGFASASPERGRLRTFLLTSLKSFIRDEWRKQQAEKRGGGLITLSFDEVVAEERYALEPVDALTPEDIYNKQWVLALLDHAVERLRERYAREGKGVLFDALRHLVGPGSTEDDYAELAAPLGMTLNNLRVTVFRLRTRYREVLMDEVAKCLDANSEEEVQAELGHLLGIC